MKLTKYTAVALMFSLIFSSSAFAAKKSKTSSKKDVDAFVYSKYASPTNSAKQEEWGPLNCHDPKI